MKRLLSAAGLLACLFWTQSAFAAIAVVQHSAGTSAVNNSTIALTVTATGSGNLLIVGAINYDSRTVSGVSDGTNAFTQVPSCAFVRSGTDNGDMWYLPVSTSGKTTMTVTFSGASTGKNIYFWEVSGFTSPVLDGTCSVLSDQVTGASDINGASRSTTASAGFLAAIMSTIGGAASPIPQTGNDFTAGGDFASGSSGSDPSASKISAAAGANQPVWAAAFGAGLDYGAATVAFKETSGGTAKNRRTSSPRIGTRSIQ